MRVNKTFGECLKELMGVFNLKGSILAKGINVDSSLVYKWLRNERVPSYNSAYIDLIANFFVKNIINSFQKENVTKALRECGFQISDGDLISISNAIHTCLLETQGYSIEIYNKKSIDEKRETPSKVENLLKALDVDSTINGVSCQESTGFRLSDDMPWSSDNVKIIMGQQEVLYTALALLQSAPDRPDNNNDTILITLNSNMDLLPDYKEFNAEWKHALYKVLNKGWKIIFLVRLNNNVKRAIKIIEDMQLALATGKYYIYYLKKNADVFTASELVIVPQKGALYCFSSRLKNQVDSAFLLESKQSIELLSGHFFQLFSSAKPLLHSYPSQKSAEFQHMFAEIEENLGDRYAFKGDISTITIPMNVYEKYLKMTRKTEEEISLRLSFHRRRLEAFEAQIKHYKFRDIWFKESLEKLVNEKKYSFDQYYILENNIPDSKDIICHLENVVNMLESYENYEIAIVSKKDYENICKICWMIKENSSVFIEAVNPNTQEKNNHDCYNSEINLLISEKEVVNAFQDYFMMIWNEISYSNKEREKVVKWFRSQIDFLKNN